MPISLFDPLQRAWERMVRMLFRPFQARTWFVLGFAAFLSEFLSGGTATHYGWHGHGDHWRHGEFASRIHEWLSEPGIIVAAVCVGAVALVAAIALLWVSCRGRFIFLDDVVHERAAIVDPWHRYARLGDSLFIWSLLFILGVGVLLLVIALPFLASLQQLWAEGSFSWTGVLSILGFVVLAIPLAILIGYTLLFLNAFVVPIMYRHELTTVPAWSRFLALFRQHPWWFIGYGLMVLAIRVVVITLVFVVSVSTCCVGFFIFAAPYIGQVALLPALATVRAYGPEFLAQFGPEYDVLAAGAKA